MTSQDELQALLQKTSRTFALTIPLLAEPTRREVGVAYLLFRLIDTFEDATLWPAEARVQALDEFCSLMNDFDVRRAAAAAEQWSREPPLQHAGYLELIERIPLVFEWKRALRPAAVAVIGAHLTRTAQGMARFVRRTSGEGVLRLETLQDLREYCFVVAGIVGQMLTELYVLGCPQLEPVAGELRARETRFGEGLQLVNILKDAQPDAAEGRVYLPPGVAYESVFELAQADLIAALEYTEIMRAAQADLGMVRFNALNARLALATLRELGIRGPGSKLSRLQLSGIAADVMRSIQNGVSLFPEI